MAKEFNPADPVFRDLKETTVCTKQGIRRKYIAVVESEDPKCPKEKQDGPLHPIQLSDMKQFSPRHDIVNGEIALVELEVRYWYCKKCSKKFADPACPYKGTKSTSQRFDDFIAQELFSHISET